MENIKFPKLYMKMLIQFINYTIDQKIYFIDIPF